MATATNVNLLMYSGLSDAEERRLMALEGDVMRELLALWRTDRCIWSAGVEIGAGWSGILNHDGFASYERFEGAVHQQCVAHVLRRARELLEGATRGAVRFP